MDLIILAAIAIFILLKLKNQIGIVDPQEQELLKKKLQEKMQKMQEEILQKEQKNQTKASAPKESAIKDQSILGLDDLSQKNLEKILSKTNMTLDYFVDGSKSAFEMTLKAFSGNDASTLKSLLAPKILKGFEDSISHRQNLGQKLVTNLISIKNAQIKKIDLIGNEASIKMTFISKQINYIIDQNSDKIIEGSREEIKELSDSWTYTKNLDDQNPNWIITSTN